jgi:hypothetical protein
MKMARLVPVSRRLAGRVRLYSYPIEAQFRAQTMARFVWRSFQTSNAEISAGKDTLPLTKGLVISQIIWYNLSCISIPMIIKAIGGN